MTARIVLPWITFAMASLAYAQGIPAADTPEALLKRAASFVQAGDYRYGVGDLNRVLRAEPNNSKALGLRGIAYFKMGETQKSLDDLSNAIKLNASDPSFFLGRAEAYEKFEKLPEALADRDTAVKLNPQSPEALFARGNTHLALKNYPSAAADFKESLRLKPDQEETRAALERAETEIARADIARARQDLNKPKPIAAAEPVKTPEPVKAPEPAAVAVAPTTPAPAAPIFRKSETTHEATASSTAAGNASALSRGSAAEHETLGRALLRDGKLEDAIAELNQALQAAPSATAFNARGFAYYLSKDTTKALADFDEALRLNPNYVNAYQNRSAARKAAGDKEGSASDSAKARELVRK